jgi:hypothetical protein
VSDKSRREKLITEYRDILKKIRKETDEQKKRDLIEKSSEIHREIVIEESGGDKNIGRFSTF